MTNAANIAFSKGTIEVRVGGWGAGLSPLKVDKAFAAIVSRVQELIPALNNALTRVQATEPGETTYNTTITESPGSGGGASVALAIRLNVQVSEHVPAMLLSKITTATRAALAEQLLGPIDDELVLRLLGLHGILTVDLFGDDRPPGPKIEHDYYSPRADDL